MTIICGIVHGVTIYRYLLLYFHAIEREMASSFVTSSAKSTSSPSTSSKWITVKGTIRIRNSLYRKLRTGMSLSVLGKIKRACGNGEENGEANGVTIEITSCENE